MKNQLSILPAGLAFIKTFVSILTLVGVVMSASIVRAATPVTHDSGYVKTLSSSATTNTVTNRGFYAFWCTDYAAYRLQKSGVPFYNQWPTGSGRWGNAAEWEGRASSLGVHTLPTGDRAYGKYGIVLRTSGQPGDTAIWRATSTNRAGHVAYVQSVGVVEEYNWQPAFAYSKRTFSSSNWKPSIFLGITPPRNTNALTASADSTSLTVKPGKQIETKIRLRNNGDTPITITATVQSGDVTVLGRTNNLNNAQIAPQGTAIVGVLFRPSKVGTYRTTFTLASTGGLKSVIISGSAK